MASSGERREQLVELFKHLRDQHECPLKAGRTNLVFGSGNADADLMFVGEAPGANEDRQGKPFVGRAGKLLDELLAEIDLDRDAVFVANVLKCLRYTVPVQLADGSWERIGRLVRSRYSGEVMSVDEDGSLVARRVIGWHATPLGGRSVFRMTYRSAKRAGAGRVGTELTGDHPVLTERGFVPVEDLRAGDRVATGQGLTPLVHDVVCGTLLGDGSLSGSSAHLSFSHSGRQREYARFKANLLSELNPRFAELRVAAAAGESRTYPVVQVRTLAHRALGVLRSDFYRPVKGVPAWLADQLNERMLAIWFMDDGYTRIRPPNRRPLAEIATNAFDEADLQVLLTGLHRLGLPAKAHRRRLYFDARGTEALCERIAPFVPPSMRYKIDPNVEQQLPFDPRLWTTGPRRVLFDEIDVENVTHRSRADTTFFCVDVEATHNFVTGGGVVHNCRPPGNRDPLPAEIEECTPHLLRQVELIEPRVICTLGNFATKLLSGRPDGITKVHGRPQDREVAGRAVRLYPLFHPAAALRTEAVRGALRDDFLRLPELLSEPRPSPAEANPLAPVDSRPDRANPSAAQDDQAGEPPPQLGFFE